MVLGDRRTRALYLALLAVPFVVVLALAPAAAVDAARAGRGAAGGAAGADRGRAQPGRDLVPVLRDTGRLQLAYAALLALGLALS